MSGIFKSVKKTLKKVGKFIKKIAPVLIIAAGVYFGGAYLMSSGAASAGAAGSVGTSFTKAAGVWKSFIGGMSNGTASQSAAAFAEASYQASQGAGALPVSGQVAAGTSAVNALSTMGSTAEAVTAGVNFAKNSWAQAGGNAQGGWDILINGLTKSQNAVANEAAKAAGGLIETSGEQLLSTDQLSTLDAEMSDQTRWMADNTRLGSGEVTTGSSVVSTGAGADGTKILGAPNELELATGAEALDQSGGPQSIETTSSVPSQTQAQSFAEGQKELFSLWREQMADSKAERLAMMKHRTEISRAQLMMQGGGMLLSAIGASEDSPEEKKHKRRMAFEPTGREEYASGAGLMYPKGLIA